MRQIQVPEKDDFVVIGPVQPAYLKGAVVKVESVLHNGTVKGIIDHIPNQRGGNTRWCVGSRVTLRPSLIERVVEAA